MLIEGLTGAEQAPIKRDADGNLCVAGNFAMDPPVGGATEAKQDDQVTLLAGGLPAALTAGGALKVAVMEGEADPSARTPTTTSVASSAVSGTLLAANANRRGVSIANLSTQYLYLSFSTPATTANSFMRLDPGMFVLLDQQLIVTGAIYGIWAAANGTAQVTEYV